MFLKEAALSVGKTIFNPNTLSRIQKQFLVQIVFFTALKNYISRCITNEQILVIPEKIRNNSQNGKIIVVLDMDQTLVHTRSLTKPSHKNYITSGDMYIEQRPYLQEFLKASSQIFTLFVYTAGDRQYADQVIDAFDKNNLIQRRFYRDHCKKIRGNLVKDLQFIKRKFKINSQMILVDDNSESINKNYPFAVKAKAFEGQQQDRQLLSVFELLLKFYNF